MPENNNTLRMVFSAGDWGSSALAAEIADAQVVKLRSSGYKVERFESVDEHGVCVILEYVRP